MAQSDATDQPAPDGRETARPRVAHAISWGTLAGIILIALVGTAGRLLALDRVPGGLAEVEASHGLLARQAGESGPVWAAGQAGDLSMPLVSLIALIGTLSEFNETTPRLAAALAGGVSLLFTGLWLRRELGPLWGLAGAAVLAGSFWHILFSRLATGQIAGAMSLSAALWLLSMALSRRDTGPSLWYLLAGVAVGVGFLSTPALRLLPVLLAGLLAASIYRECRGPNRSGVRNWLIATGAGLLTITPFLIVTRDDPVAWTPWASTAGLPGDDRATLLTFPDAIIQSVTGLVLSGDADRGFNLPADPWFSLLMLPWAVVGLIGLVNASNDPALRDRFLAGAAGVLALLIGISAVDAGHSGQYVVVSPLLAGLVAYGFRTALNWERMTSLRVALGLALILFGVAAEAYYSWDHYRNGWAREAETKSAVNAGLVDAVGRARDLPSGESVFLNESGGQVVLDYLDPPERLHTFNGGRSLPFPAEENGYLLTPHAPSISPALEPLLAEVPRINSARDRFGYALYRLDQRIRQQMPFGIPTYQYGDGPALLGGRIAGIDDDALTVLVAWNLPAGSAGYLVDVRLAGTDGAGAESQATITLPRNPLSSPLYRVVVAEVALPENIARADLEVRLRDADGQPLQTGGVDQDGFILLNRYQLPERNDG